MKAALLVCALLLVACDTNECGSVDIRGFITGPLEVNVDCPGDQDISPGNSFAAEGTVTGLGLRAPRPPSSVRS